MRTPHCTTLAEKTQGPIMRSTKELGRREPRGLAGSGEERAMASSTRGRGGATPNGEDGVDPRCWRDGRCRGQDGGHRQEEKWIRLWWYSRRSPALGGCGSG